MLDRVRNSLTGAARVNLADTLRAPIGGRTRVTATGLDIEPGAVTAVTGDGTGRSVMRAVSASLGAGVVREGEVGDPELLARTLEGMFAQSRMDKNVRVGVANQRIVMRTLDLPRLESDKEIASAVQFQAQEQIPMPLAEAVLQHRVQGPVETPDGPRTRVLLVAARRDMIYGLLAAVRAAGLRPVGIDLSAFAMIRALYSPERTGGVLYVNVGGITTMAVAEGRDCLFTRTTGPGLESMAEDLAERRGVTLQTARSWLHRGGIEEPLGAGGETAAAVLDARSAMMTGIGRIADDIRNTLAFQMTQLHGVAVERAVVTGAAAGINGFADALAAELGLPTEVGTVREGALLAFGGLPPTGLTVASGLTVEEAR